MIIRNQIRNAFPNISTYYCSSLQLHHAVLKERFSLGKSMLFFSVSFHLAFPFCRLFSFNLSLSLLLFLLFSYLLECNFPIELSLSSCDLGVSSTECQTEVIIDDQMNFCTNFVTKNGSLMYNVE